MAIETTRPNIGPYRVIRMLGRGGFGTVFLAEQLEPVRREVALKVLNPGMDFEEIHRRFEAERETLNLMKHPGISMLLDAGATEDGEPYFVMEYVPGTPLGRFVADTPMTLHERLELFCSICEAVQHAHNKGVIHRDLSAGNVLVVDMDGRPTPKIIDFGIAKSIGTALPVSMHTMEGQAMGTPSYMSPEQAMGRNDQIDTRTDIYALGAQLYLILTNTLPLTKDELRDAGVAILQVICEHEAEPPSARLARFPEARSDASLLRGELDWITSKAMAKDLSQRYASVAELAEDVRRFMRGEAVLAGPPTTWYRLSKLIRRHRGRVVAAAAVLVSLIVGLIVSTNLYVRSSANAAEAELNLGRFNLLSDVLLLDTLRAQAGELGPGRPENAAAMEDWLARADGLLARLDVLREVMRESASDDPEATEPENRARRFLHKELTDLVAGLEQFAGAPDSPLASVRARLAWAGVVRARTIEDHADAWAAAVQAVAEDARFEGFELRPQLGLVPLGPDPDSGLQEFVLLRTGSIPARDGAGGRVVPEVESGVVLVLIPGGETLIGAQAVDESAPHYDPSSERREAWLADVDGEERPQALRVTLAPGLVSKYELTQAQWSRMTGGDTPSVTASSDYEPYGVTPLCPVENLTHERAREVLAEFGLELPTEAQWEHACRAGTGSVWSCGEDEASLAGQANLADVSAREVGLKWEVLEGAFLDDGFPYTSPVGTFAPNAFGLHDMHGNVYERCLDPWGPYQPELFSGPNALRASADAEDERYLIIRGGTYRYRARFARSAYRWYTDAQSASPDVGVRPVMPLRD